MSLCCQTRRPPAPSPHGHGHGAAPSVGSKTRRRPLPRQLGKWLGQSCGLLHKAHSSCPMFNVIPVSVSRPSQTGPHSEHFRQPPGYPRNIFSHYFGARNVMKNGLRHVANGHVNNNFETPHKFILLLIPLDKIIIILFFLVTVRLTPSFWFYDRKLKHHHPSTCSTKNETQS
jgi:hypothetical protein